MPTARADSNVGQALVSIFPDDLKALGMTNVSVPAGANDFKHEAVLLLIRVETSTPQMSAKAVTEIANNNNTLKNIIFLLYKFYFNDSI